jgi:hypothetical protein
MPVTLPGPEATHRWQGRTLVDHDGEPLGSIEAIYLDKATEQPEWALLEAGATGPSRTYVPLVSANEDGDSVRVPFAKTLVEGVPGMAADRELSEDQEQELYRHYGVPYSRADSPSGLPAGEPEPDAEPALSADKPAPAGEPVSASTPEVTAARSEVTTEEPTPTAQEPPAAGHGGGDGARPEAAATEPAPIPAAAVGSAPGRVDAAARDELGSAADPDIRPPGLDQLPARNRARAHLLGRQLGGSGDLPANLVALHQTPGQHPGDARLRERGGRRRPGGGDGPLPGTAPLPQSRLRGGAERDPDHRGR